MPTALTQTETAATPPKPIVDRPKRVNGWWEVALDNGRCFGFETEAQAKKFIRENRT